MTNRVVLRLRDISEAATHVEELVKDRTRDEVHADRVSCLALERLLEIISEASRHIPDELKAGPGAEVPWRQVADLGNNLRHAYANIDFDIIWDIATKDMAPLLRVTDAMIAAIPPSPPRS